jgi:hypothetical protein
MNSGPQDGFRFTGDVDSGPKRCRFRPPDMWMQAPRHVDSRPQGGGLRPPGRWIQPPGDVPFRPPEKCLQAPMDGDSGLEG